MVLRDELGFLAAADPARRTHAVATEFLKLINRDAEALTARYAWPSEFPAELHEIVGDDGDRCWTPDGEIDHRALRVEWVHIGKVSPSLVDGLVSTGLGVPNANRTWIALHPRLGTVYLSALADRVAQASDMAVVTDQPDAYGTLKGWRLDTLARVLLGDETSEYPVDRSGGEIAAL
jgi:hypothetical protein